MKTNALMQCFVLHNRDTIYISCVPDKPKMSCAIPFDLLPEYKYNFRCLSMFGIYN